MPQAGYVFGLCRFSGEGSPERLQTHTGCVVCAGALSASHPSSSLSLRGFNTLSF